ncbi:MAG: hypothetical protein RL653_1760 [Pseudomonadota bacterium]|jgi:hypothetical protein
MSHASPHRPTALAGAAGVLLNLVAVAALGPVPHTYAPGNVAAWQAETVAAPGHSTVSAWAFTLGLVLLAAFAAGFSAAAGTRGRAWGLLGAALFGGGALLNAAGTMAPVAVLHVSADAGEALLWMTLLLDAGFNALLGLGLLAWAAALAPEDGWPRWLRAWAAVAGLASLPVALQFHSDTFARLLAVSGPLWTGWVLAASWKLWRRA